MVGPMESSWDASGTASVAVVLVTQANAKGSSVNRERRSHEGEPMVELLGPYPLMVNLPVLAVQK